MLLCPPPLDGASSDAGVPVYLYEFAYRADMHRHSRPGFVKADHGDDVAFIFGSCFWDGHTKLLGRWQSRDPRRDPPPSSGLWDRLRPTQVATVI